MKPLSNRVHFVCLVVVALVLAACSGVHTPTSGGGGGGATGPYSISGTVTGLTGTGLVLQDNGGDNLPVTAAGPFTFATSVASGGAFAVTVATQPTNPAQSCAVTGGSGAATANVTTVAVACTTAATNATVGVNVSGLTGAGLVLQDNGGDSLTITANGSSTFKTAVTGAYAVTVLTQPIGPAQLCTVVNGSGTATANVTVTVTCVVSYTIGGTVTGVVGTGLVLQNTGGEKLTITTNGPFTFVNQVPTGTAYTVTIAMQPSTPAQTCVVTPGTASGSATANVTTVAITCSAVTYSVGGQVVGLLGKQPTPPPNNPLTDNSFQLLNNGGDNKIITQNGPFTFATPVALNGAFFVSAISFPSTQSQGCTLWGYSGVATANVNSILVDCAHDDWTFIGGTKTAGTDPAPQYGAFTVPAVPPATEPNPYTNTPGGRDSGAAWADASGNLWLFGGLGYELSGKTPPDTLSGFQSDLWECQFTGADYCEWELIETQVGGLYPIAQNEDLPGSYGTKGVAASGNLPGGRWGSATWTDGSGNLWLYGGQGDDSLDNAGLLSDLWKYNISSGNWTWVSGSKVVNQKGTYTGVPGTLFPGARWSPVSWKDHSGNFWLFGGFGYDVNGNLGFLSDLWEYTGGNWVFVSSTVPSSDLLNQNGVYGTQGTAAAGNTPGGRQTGVGWTDASGNLWLFGGEGEDSTGTANGVLNDLWEYNITSNQWTFVAGSTHANQTGNYGLQPLIGPADTASAAGTVGLTPVTAGIFPGSRWGATAWTDAAGNLWLFGGWGLDATGTNGNGYLNDLWVYTPDVSPTQPGTWTWVKGSNTGNENGVYGPETRPYFTKVDWTPGARRGAMSWVDGRGDLWLYGGQGYDSTSSTGNGYLNDLWRYLPYP
jgi:Galactose oxidase, central domain/Kelch motif